MIRIIFIVLFWFEVSVSQDCIPTSGPGSYVTFTQDCLSGNVLFIERAYFVRTNYQWDCSYNSACSSSDVSNDLKIVYSIEQGFSRNVYVPQIAGGCGGPFVNLAVVYYCFGGAPTIVNMYGLELDLNIVGNFYIYARYNMNNNNGLPLNKIIMTIPPNCKFVIRPLELYALSRKASNCAYNLFLDKDNSMTNSKCMANSFSSDYYSGETNGQNLEVTIRLENMLTPDDALVDLKAWIMIEVRDNQNIFVSGVRVKAISSATTTTSTTSTTTSTTTSRPTTTTTITTPTTSTTIPTTRTTTTPTTTTTSTTTVRPVTTTAPTTTTTKITAPTITSTTAVSSTTTATSNVSIPFPSSTTAPSPPLEQLSNGLTTEAKVGLGVGLSILSLFILLSIIGVIVLCCRRSRSANSVAPSNSKTFTRHPSIEEGYDNDAHSIDQSEPSIIPPPPITYADAVTEDQLKMGEKYKPIRKKGSQKTGLSGLVDIFNQDPTSIYYPIEDVYSTVSKAESRNWHEPHDISDVTPETVGRGNSYPSDTWELTHYALPEEHGDDYWDQDGTIGPPMTPVHFQPGKTHFQKNSRSNNVTENNSKQKVKKAKHVSISNDPPSYMESQMDRPINFMSGSNFMF